MKRLAVLAVAIVAACNTPKETVVTQPADEVLILDSLLIYDSEQQLINRFGAENIARDTAWYPEGMGQYVVTLLYPGTKNEVSFSWLDPEAFIGLEELEVSADSSAWTTRGVRIGTSMTELVELNGDHFTFSGFGWDYGGYVNWDDGELDGLSVILESSEAMMAQEQYDSLTGDRMVSTRSTAAKINNPVVRAIKLIKQRE